MFALRRSMTAINRGPPLTFVFWVEKRGQTLMSVVTCWLLSIGEAEDPKTAAQSTGSAPNLGGVLIKLVSICQAENSENPKVGLKIFNHGCHGYHGCSGIRELSALSA